ncbi:YtrH family sporulation protein [Desulfosporosinus hippei]|uniref:Sporulation protein YtrH n=1 Tax=Desulfosporosinus hippei DSM 8344 TaxID=1121419 RepID=A0A1G8LUT9_9FIRM|nr:YtrH family sporulation protein [Desulfosporosinus hippei]SDI59426.1 Sporulation protein YtrH [Desulfosporosinus hippei DSM 8344]
MVIILSSLFSSIVNNFLISFGVVVGASIFGGIGAVKLPTLNRLLMIRTLY